jgi:hypothetical protein
MKRTTLVLYSALVVAPACSCAADQMIPAGSLIQCTISEPKLSSKTANIGDPVLCQMSHYERYGRSLLPYNSYMEGRFEDYKDPGHFVGKGWMELKFDRMVIEPDTVVPVEAKVVGVPGYNVDRNGRILGKGHVARDIVLWSIPILWPIDLLMLPARGPRPTLKTETQLTLKVMDDLEIPQVAPPQRDPYGLIPRGPSAEAAPPPQPYADQPPPEQAQNAPVEPPEPEPAPPPMPVYVCAPPPPRPAYVYAVPPPPPYMYPPPYVYAAPPPVVYGYGYGYGGGAAIGFYRGYGGGVARGYAVAPRAYGYGGAPRGYAYGVASRSYAAAPRMAAGYGYGGMSRGGAGRSGR